ncbi:hypothetical protein IWQ61_009887 [Dispira simplex]|nr:hypothetical protein IWQ61_009887 [Dispira simplex]
MRFAHLATIATLVVSTTAANPNPNSCDIGGLVRLNLIINLNFRIYKEEGEYLKRSPNSSVASSVTLYNRIQVPYLQLLCGEVKLKDKSCGPIAQRIITNPNCKEIAKLSPSPKAAAKR